MKSNLIFWSGVLCASLLFSCKETIIPEGDLLTSEENLSLQFRDSFDIETYTVADTPLIAKNLSIQLLGSIYDPFFGTSFASFYTTLRLPTNNVNLGTSPTLDSAFINLKIKDRYGKRISNPDILIYELDENLDANAEYLNNRSFAVKSSEIARLNGVNTDSLTSLRIPVTSTFAQNLLNQSGTSNLADNTAFQNYIKGLFITTNSSLIPNQIFDIDIAGGSSSMDVYYHNPSDTTKKFTFILNADCIRVNSYFNRTSGSPAYSTAQSPMPGGDDKIYLLGLTGYKSYVKINNLDRLTNEAVNLAELWFFALNDSTQAYPDQLYLARVDSLGNDQLILDYSYEGRPGGTITRIEYAGQMRTVYKLNVTRYVQNILKGDFRNDGLRLYIFPTNVTSERVVLGGGKHTSLPVKFRLVTTKIQ